MNCHDCSFLVALGANLPSRFGGPRQTLEWVVEQMACHRLSVDRQSRWYLTPAFPAGSGPDFVNGAIALRSDRSPEDVLDILHAVEAECGRVREERWSPRACDIDLVAHGDAILPTMATWRRWADLPLARQQREQPDGLILPHPRLHERAFVLLPLSDIAADWRHPILNRTVAEMLADMPENTLSEIRQI